MNNKCVVGKRILLTILSIVVLCILLEMIVRVTGAAPVFHRLSLDPVNTPDHEGSYRLSDNPVIFYEPTPNSGVFNSFGIRGPEPEKVKKRQRIVFIGDSVGYGVNLPYEITFAGLLAEKLKENYEVLNFSVPGYGLLQYQEVLEKKVLPLKPDFVLFAICMNDFDGATLEFYSLLSKVDAEIKKDKDYLKKFSLFRAWQSGPIKYLFGNSDLLKFILYRISLIESLKREDFKNESISDDMIGNIISRFNSLSLKSGFKFSFVFLPQGGLDIHKKDLSINQIPNYLEKTKLIKKLGIDNLDLHDKYFSLKKSAFYQKNYSEIFMDPWHFNESGHLMVSENLQDYFQEFLKSRIDPK